jgi:hypothetical protein
MRTTTHGMTRYIAPFLNGGEVQWKTRKAGDILKTEHIKVTPEGVTFHRLTPPFTLEEAMFFRDGLDEAIDTLKGMYTRGVSLLYSAGAFKDV